MDRGALDDTLESSRGHGFRAFHVGDQCGQVVVDEFHQSLAQFFQVDIARLHHAGGVGLIHKRQQKVFERRQFMASRIGQRQRCMDCLFQCVRK